MAKRQTLGEEARLTVGDERTERISHASASFIRSEEGECANDSVELSLSVDNPVSTDSIAFVAVRASHMLGLGHEHQSESFHLSLTVAQLRPFAAALNRAIEIAVLEGTIPPAP